MDTTLLSQPHSEIGEFMLINMQKGSFEAKADMYKAQALTSKVEALQGLSKLNVSQDKIDEAIDRILESI